MSTPSAREPARTVTGRGRPRARPAAEDRELVLAAAIAAFARPEPGGIEQIARAAGVHRSRVYELFGSRDGLFAACVDAAEGRLAATVAEAVEPVADPADTGANVRATFHAVTAYVVAHPDDLAVLRAARRSGVAGRLGERLAPALSGLTTRLAAAHGMDPGRATGILVAMYVGMAESVLTLDWSDGQPDLEDLAELMTEFTIGGVLQVFVKRPEVLHKLA